VRIGRGRFDGQCSEYRKPRAPANPLSIMEFDPRAIAKMTLLEECHVSIYDQTIPIAAELKDIDCEDVRVAIPHPWEGCILPTDKRAMRLLMLDSCRLVTLTLKSWISKKKKKACMVKYGFGPARRQKRHHHGHCWLQAWTRPSSSFSPAFLATYDISYIYYLLFPF
jgi:hypothetical protein